MLTLLSSGEIFNEIQNIWFQGSKYVVNDINNIRGGRLILPIKQMDN
jgi:hypothetical protein